MLRKSVIGSLSVGVVGVLCVTAVLLASPSNAPVADAAMKGDTDAVRSLLGAGADVNATQGDGMTALHWAAVRGDVELAEVLISAGAEVAATNRLGAYTPLLLASKSGSAPMINTLLVAGAEANPATTTTEMTPLMLAATAGSADAVTLLLEHGADVNATESSHGQTALMFAAALNHVDAVEALMEYDADPAIATDVRMPPTRPREGGVINRNFQRERDRSDPLGGLTALIYAARQGHTESALALVEAGADIDQVSPANRVSPLVMATINGRFDLAMALLERGADPNQASTWGMTPLYAVMNVQWAPHAFYPTPSADQERATHMELVRTLLDHGADPDARMTARRLWYNVYASGGVGNINESGATAFWRAAQSSDVEAMRLLMAFGADPNIPTTEGTSPLNVAAGAGWRGNLNVNAPVGWMSAVRYLVEELGADVSEGNVHGYTPLHAAAERGDNQMILYFVGKGADVKAVTTRGETVTDMANGPRQRIRPFRQTIALLGALGAPFSHKCISC
jgi:ankyrin repeat protein